MSKDILAEESQAKAQNFERLIINGKEVPLKTKEEKEAELAKKKAELDGLLSRGEIDGAEYNQRLIELMVPEKNIKYKVKAPRKIRAIIAACFTLVVVAVLVVVAIQINWRYYFQNSLNGVEMIDYDDDQVLSEEGEPIQTMIEITSEDGTYKGRPINMQYKAYYDITATVASVHDYWGFGDYDTLVPRDVCLVWGHAAESFLKGDLTFSQSNRACGLDTQTADLDPSEINSTRNVFGSRVEALLTMSNNHLIASTPEIRDKILGLKARDKVRIIGFLVTVKYNDITLNSSTRRDDTANGACEVIYVTDIEVWDNSSQSADK